MSQENVEIAQRIYDGWSHGDFSVGTNLMAPDFEWHQHAEAVEPGSHRGAAIGGAITKIFEVYEDFRVGPEEYIDTGDQVMVTARVQATGKGSGVELDVRYSFVWTVRGGQLAELAVFLDRSQALESSGLGD